MENNTKDIATCTGNEESVSSTDSTEFNLEEPNNDEHKNDTFEANANANEDAGNEDEDEDEDKDECNFPPCQ